MKILMVMNSKGVGGAELQFIELASFLSKGHEVYLLGLQGDGALRQMNLLGESQVKVFAYTSKRSSIPELLKAAVYARGMRPEVVISTSFIGNAVALAAALGRGVRLISLQTVSKVMAYPFLDYRILDRFDVLLAGCKDIQDYLLNRGHRAEQIRVVNNWVDFSARTPTLSVEETKARFGIQQGKIVIGCIGRMHHQKGQEYLIRAFRRIREVRSDVALVLVGDGPTMAAMKGEASGCEDVVFTGTANGEDYNNLLNMFDVYVQPSRFEGLPRTLLDAMYMRKPIIATATNGIRDAITDGVNGLLVEPENPEAIQNALLRLLSHNELMQALCTAARQVAQSDFSAASQLAKIDHIVRELA